MAGEFGEFLASGVGDPPAWLELGMILEIQLAWVIPPYLGLRPEEY